MNTWIRLAWILAIMLWISLLIALIIALTDLIPNNILQPYRILLGIGLITVTGFMRNAYKKSKDVNA